MSNSDANQRCMICRAIGFVIAAIIVGLITWWLFSKVAAWLAILAFLGLFALGLWLVLKYCGDPMPHGVDHGHGHGDGSMTGATAAAGAAVAGAAIAGSSGSADTDADAAARAKADADAAAARAKADADAAAAKAKADADAAARAKAEADAAAKAKADAASEEAKRAAEVEAARAKAELDAAKAKAEAERAAAASTETVSTESSRAKAVADGMARSGGAGTSVGTKPQGLSSARAGGADDLKRIKGVGPKMETMLNGMGYYHFDQVADWGDQEVAWVDDNLEGFKGRVTRDRWVPQAKLLAGGTAVSDDVLEKIKAGEEVDLTDYDGDGISEGMGEGSKPMTLDGPRGGKADDLKLIKGVGPKLEGVINDLGFYHFDQIAAWTKDEIAWVDMRLKFKGRIERDGWIDQARLLASGGETEFSKKVEDGDVY